jgi:lactate dehydrogenase-like 2-hydroxyacid dehydrogenase
VFADVLRPRAKILANFGVGYNHIDVQAATKAGVIVTNTPGAVTDATADIALMLMLMTARRAGEGELPSVPEADVITGGALVASRVAQRVSVSELVISESDILDGIAMELLR